MISQLESYGVGLKTGLFAQIGRFIFPCIVVNESYRDDKGDISLTILMDNFNQFLPFTR